MVQLALISIAIEKHSWRDCTCSRDKGDVPEVQYGREDAHDLHNLLRHKVHDWERITHLQKMVCSDA